MILQFGIYPGGATGTADGTILCEVPDEPVAIRQAIQDLRGESPAPFLIRGYAPFVDLAAHESPRLTTPAHLLQYIQDGCRLDLVAQFQTVTGNIDGYLNFIRQLIDEYGPFLATLQIAEESNVTDNPTLDGAYPGIQEAVVKGVIAAKNYARKAGFPHILVGVNSTVLFGPAMSFYQQLVELGGQPFVEALDYIGLDAFPDVFRPFDGDLEEAVVWLIEHHRTQVLTPAGLNHLPLHITEHGWPTGPKRPESKQKQVLEAVIQALANRPDLRTTTYLHFSLRDAASDGTLFAGFGLMDVQYHPKPAFDAYRQLIAKLSQK